MGIVPLILIQAQLNLAQVKQMPTTSLETVNLIMFWTVRSHPAETEAAGKLRIVKEMNSNQTALIPAAPSAEPATFLPPRCGDRSSLRAGACGVASTQGDAVHKSGF